MINIKRLLCLLRHLHNGKVEPYWLDPTKSDKDDTEIDTADFWHRFEDRYKLR